MKLSYLIRNSHRHGNASYVLNIQHNVLHAFSKLLKHMKYLDNFMSDIAITYIKEKYSFIMAVLSKKKDKSCNLNNKESG